MFVRDVMSANPITVTPDVSVMEALEKADPRVVQSLAAVSMQPGQLIAQAFGGIAERAERIGQLNVSPELLRALLPASGMEAGRGNPA